MTDELALAVAEAVADANDTDPRDSDFVLGDHVDPGVFHLLAASCDSTWTFSFEVPNHSVTVKSDGEVLVDGDPERNWLHT